MRLRLRTAEERSVDRVREAVLIHTQACVLAVYVSRDGTGAREQPAVRIDDRNAQAGRRVLLEALLERFGARVQPRERWRFRREVVLASECEHRELRPEQIERAAQLDRIARRALAPDPGQ